MPSDRCAVLGALAALVALATPASADVRALIAADSYVATTSGASNEAAADIAWSAHLESRGADRDAVLDWVERESLIGGAPRRELHELSYVERGIPGIELTLGRFRVPGGYWLLADGAGVAVRSGALVAGAFGGSRSFTNGRTDTLLTSSPQPLPLIGASLALRGAIQAAASYTYTADRVSLYRGDGAMTTRREPEQFVDAELAAPIGDAGFATAGATMGTRYLVRYPTADAQIADDPALASIWFGARSAYAQYDHRLGGWRLAAGVSASQTKLAQTADPALAAIDGSFVEGALRATWRDAPTWRTDARYRARIWGDGRHSHRAEASAEWRLGALDVQARAGLDLHQGAVHTGATPAPGLVDSRTLLYRASIGRKTTSSELALGIAAVAALGDELPAAPTDDPTDQRAPYTLEARSYGFVRAFATAGAWFGGLDGELNLRGDGARALVQIGFSR
jgi:hypothetical protein